ncbi:hypothetical protein HAX54_003507 [Datura stramonium]|uniref:Uncharacterized protein n=1 Tax=Datura stramonium TaxID=4076 RepID=A0ABS8RTY5_DATST|nr:hypothetical protein [Datura stramonium]
MLEYRTSSAIVMVDNKPRGILASGDPQSECSTTIHLLLMLYIQCMMKILPSCCLIRLLLLCDVLHILSGLCTTVGNTAGVNNEAANTMMQRFWDSAMALTPDDDEETRSRVH